MDIGQGAGLSGASGVRPFIPTLLAGALARDNAGLDFGGTDYSFLENQWFLLAILCLAVAVYAANRRVETAPDLNRGWTVPGVLEKVAAVLGVVLGGLLLAGSLADHGYTSWWGIPAGIACGALGYLAVALLFDRAKRRIGRGAGTGGARSLLDAYADGVSLALAGLSIALPPVGYAAPAVFVVLIVRSRGEGARKYGGLRILR